MKNLVELFRIYHHHHTKTVTKVTHFIGVPLIILAVQILLSFLHIPIINISCAWLIAGLLSVYYLYLDISLGLLTAICFLLLTYLAHIMSSGDFNLFSFSLACLFLVIGWAAQFIGHYFEGNKPAFLTNIWQVIVAPIFLVADIVFNLGYRADLQEKIEKSEHIENQSK